VVEEVLIPSPTGCALISDIDDTFIVSHSTSLFRKLYNLLTKSVETRRIFKGVVDHYQLLMNGQSREHSNPFFYVSSSEWNLYDFIVEFCELNELPKGAFLLQDLKSGFRQLLKQSGGDHRHKEIKIIEILEKYPEYKVVLLGDSGQRDPEIYRSIAAQYPDRVAAIYIRDVRKKSKRRKKVKRIGQDLKELGIELIYFKDSSKAIKHSEAKLFGQQ